MGEQLSGTTQGHSEDTGKQGRDNKSSSTKTTSTGGRGGRGGGRTTGASKETKLPRMVSVNETDTQTKDAAVSTKKSSKTASKESTKTPSKRTQQRHAAKAKEEAGKLVPHVQMALVASFGLLANRYGQHWAITPDEAKSVAEPLAGILGQYMKANEQLEKYAPWMAVLGSVALLVVPRLLISQSLAKAKKKEGMKYGTVSEPKQKRTVVTGGTGTNEGKSTQPNRPSDAPSSANVDNGLASLLAPTIAY